MSNWHWKAGRLINGHKSLSITQAYNQQRCNPDIHKACEGILEPYSSKQNRLNADIINQLNREQESFCLRMLEAKNETEITNREN